MEIRKRFIKITKAGYGFGTGLNLVEKEQRLSEHNGLIEIQSQLLNNALRIHPIEQAMQRLILLQINRQKGLKTAMGKRLHKKRFPHLSRAANNQRLSVRTVLPVNKIVLRYSFHKKTPLDFIVLYGKI